MKHTVGSILQFTPTTTPGVVTFRHPGTEKNTWTEPLIGWAVVVRWNQSELEAEDPLEDDAGEQETELLPCVLDQGIPVTSRDYTTHREMVIFDGVTLS